MQGVWVEAKQLLPSTSSRGLLHHSRRDRRWWTGNTHPSSRVYNGDGISGPNSRWLVKLESIVGRGEGGRRDVGRGGSGGQGYSGSNLLGLYL